MRIHHSRAHDEKLTPDKVEISCETCGDVFEVYPYREESARFCSTVCNANGRERSKRGGTVTCTCDWCGDEFERYKSKSTRRNGDFCNHECYGKWRAENVVGENHPQWKHGNRDYGKGWNEKKRREVRERDGYKCRACGMSQEKHREICGAALAVHHIRPARLFDNPEKRNAEDNLVTLCRSCHHRWEGIPLRPQS
jgi:5-methylcytosine-specific restriction endonuclease McrA